MIRLSALLENTGKPSAGTMLPSAPDPIPMRPSGLDRILAQATDRNNRDIVIPDITIFIAA